MTAPPDDRDLIKATPLGRWLAAAIIIAAIALLVVVQQFIWPLFQAAFAASADTAAINHLRNAAAGIAAVGIGCAAYLLFYGRAILASGRNPPPAAPMWRPTRVMRGNAARRFGWFYLACGIVSLFACLGFIVHLNQALNDLPLDDADGTSSVPIAGAAASRR